jgi:predicted metal-dependent enzyme (double-stranded beta helix superfamily)
MDMRAALRSIAQHDKFERLARPIDRDYTATPPEVVTPILDLLRAPGEIDLDALVIAMQTLEVDVAALGDAVLRDKANYVRTLLHRDARSEMLALTWMPGQRSPVHDHGPSSSVVRIVGGVATEHLYRRREDGALRRDYMKRDLRAGVVTRSGAEALHSLGNNASLLGETLVTLHVYTPPLGASHRHH